MRTLTIAVFLLLASLLGQSVSAQVPTAPVVKLSTLDYINNVLNPATVLLFEQEEDGTMRFSCTATAIHHNAEHESYIFATASHCITEKHRPFLSLDEENGDKVFVRVIEPYCGKEETGADVCLLFAKTKMHFTVAELGDDPVSGEPIISVEAPAGMGKQVLHGYIALNKLDRVIRPDKDDDKKMDWSGDVVLQLPGVLGGSSGSAVVCEKSQKVCAITVGVYAGALGQMQIAVPISRLKKLIADYQDE